MPTRPTGREKQVTSGGSGVHKREQYASSGPVGRTESAGSGGRGQAGPGVRPSQSAGRGSGMAGGTRSSGGGPLKLIILLVVVLLGGGGGIGALLGGGGSSSDGTGGSGSSTYSTNGGSGSSYGSSYGSGYGSSYGSSYGNGYGSSYGGYGSSSSILDTLLGEFGSYTDTNSGYGSGYGSYHTASNGGTTSTGSSNAGTGNAASTNTNASSAGSAGSSSGSYGNSYGSGYGSSYGGGSGSAYDSSSVSGSDTGWDLSSLSELFGAGISTSASGVTAGWNDGRDNRGILNTEVADGSRAKFTALKGQGKDTATIMIYMCGTDLESKSGMATADLSEMANASLSDNVNLLVYTGGCTGWKNNVVSAKTNQIYRVREGGLERLVEDDGDRTMTDPATLTRFIKWSAANYPADRYQLIFWDHGSGSLSGYGYDQKHQRAGSMDLAQIKSAVEGGGVKFDFIGFDACLMATVENALALADSADYLIASEETEPGTGWYYTNWLSMLSEDTSAATTMLGARIIDDFVDVSAQKARGQSTTLSLVDLAELQHTFPAAFSAFSKDTGSLIKSSDYKTVSTARKSSREFAQSSGIDQVDLTDLAWKLGTQEGRELADVLLGAVKYNRTSTSMCNSYGLSVYFPGSRLSKVDSMVSTYKQLGIDSDYTRCIQQYAAVSASGQSASGGSTSVFDMLSGYGGSYGSSASSSGSYAGSSGGSYSIGNVGSDMLMDLVGSLLSGRSIPLEGLDSSNTAFLKESGLTAGEIVQTLQSDYFDADALTWDTSSGESVLYLDDAAWEQVASLTVNMLYDDGEGYLDLGEDNTFTFTDTGDLLGETDRTWLSINGQPVAFYHSNTVEEGESSTTIGRVPCLLNGERVDLIIAFDAANPYGYIAGARTDYVDGETETLAKAMTKLTTGDRLDFLCDYYAYDGTYSSTWLLGEPMYVEDVMVISNTDVGEGGALVTYRFEDLYGQSYWTAPIYE